MNQLNTLCQFLDWDSNFFQIRVAKINQNHLDHESIKKITDWAKQQNIDCLYFLAASDDSDRKSVV